MEALNIAFGGFLSYSVAPGESEIPGRLRDGNSLQVSEIDMMKYLNPFVRIMEPLTRPFRFTIVLIASVSYRSLVAIQDVFFRILFKPHFDPQSLEFQTKMTDLKAQILPLKKRILDLEHMFIKKYELSRDIEEFYTLIEKVRSEKEELQGYVEVLNTSEFTLPFYLDVKEVSKEYEDLVNQINIFSDKKFLHILKKFKRTSEAITNTDVAIPKDITVQIIQMWSKLCNIFELLGEELGNTLPEKGRDHELRMIKSIADEIENQISSLNPQEPPRKAANSVYISAPLSLKYNKNSCHMHSALQFLLCSDVVRDQIKNGVLPPVGTIDPATKIKLSGKDVKAIGSIKQELVKLIKGPKIHRPVENLSLMQLYFYLLYGPSSDRLRHKIFNANLHAELRPDTIYEQCDASAMVECLIDHLLSDKFQFYSQIRYERADLFPGMEFFSRKEPSKTLQISLFTDPKIAKQKLSDLIAHDLAAKQTIVDPNNKMPCDPKTALITDPSLANVNLPPQAVDQVKQWYQLENAPSAMVIHLKRFTQDNKTNQPIKLEDPIEMPLDGIVNMTPYFKNSADKKVRYKIKSYICHDGALGGGHYTAFVNKGDKFFRCDDNSSTLYDEITSDQFYKNPQPYMILLEKIAEEPDLVVE